MSAFKLGETFVDGTIQLLWYNHEDQEHVEVGVLEGEYADELVALLDLDDLLVQTREEGFESGYRAATKHLHRSFRAGVSKMINQFWNEGGENNDDKD